MIPYGRQCIDEDDIQAVIDVLRSDWFTTGPKVTEFEETMVTYLITIHAIAVANGTAALHSAMYSLGINHGDYTKLVRAKKGQMPFAHCC